MNSNISKESLITSMEKPCIHLNSLEENQQKILFPLEHTMQQVTPLHITQTGETVSNQILMPFGNRSQSKTEINSGKPSQNLLSKEEPRAILEKFPPEPKVLKVNKEDVLMLCQLIREFHEQVTNL
jgi:hypothetical protein